MASSSSSPPISFVSDCFYFCKRSRRKSLIWVKVRNKENNSEQMDKVFLENKAREHQISEQMDTENGGASVGSGFIGW